MASELVWVDLGGFGWNFAFTIHDIRYTSCSVCGALWRGQTHRIYGFTDWWVSAACGYAAYRKTESGARPWPTGQRGVRVRICGRGKVHGVAELISFLQTKLCVPFCSFLFFCVLVFGQIGWIGFHGTGARGRAGQPRSQPNLGLGERGHGHRSAAWLSQSRGEYGTGLGKAGVSG
jgi:hypothetical protein